MASTTSTFGSSVSRSAAHNAKLIESSRLPPDVRTNASMWTLQTNSPDCTQSALRSTTPSVEHKDSRSRESFLLESSALLPSEKATETEAAQDTLTWRSPWSGKCRLGLVMSHLTQTIRSVSPARSLQEPVADGMGPNSNEIRL